MRSLYRCHCSEACLTRTGLKGSTKKEMQTTKQRHIKGTAGRLGPHYYCPPFSSVNRMNLKLGGNLVKTITEMNGHPGKGVEVRNFWALRNGFKSNGTWLDIYWLKGQSKV